MNLFDYYWHHAIPTGWQTIRSAFVAWKDLLSGNWEKYALLKDDDPYTECQAWFWLLLGENNVYPKDFLEHLLEIVERINHPDFYKDSNLINFESMDDLLRSSEDGDV